MHDTVGIYNHTTITIPGLMLLQVTGTYRLHDCGYRAKDTLNEAGNRGLAYLGVAVSGGCGLGFRVSGDCF